MTATPRRVRLWLFRLATVLGALVVGFLVAEGAVRLFPGLLNEKLQHAAFSRFDTLPGGIFQFEGITRSRFMRADHQTRAYSHGYFWTHETDRHGYRNPAGIDDHRVLLLGDSTVYGHGVESHETTAHFLRADHGVAAYDMSAQGQCIYDHYLALRLALDEFRPETVLLFVYVNDINDLASLGRAQVKLQRSLEVICSRQGLELVDTREFFEGRTDWILPSDGHLNPEGNREFAGFLSREVLGQPSSVH